MTPAMCLALAVFFEARAESVEGMAAVAAVVENRVADPRWPDNTCDVVFQPKQFSWTHDGKSDNPEKYVTEKEAWKTARRVAQAELRGEGLSITSNHYHATYVRPSWSSALDYDGKIGNHVFYTWD